MPAGNPLLKGKTKSGPNSLGKNGYDNGNCMWGFRFTVPIY